MDDYNDFFEGHSWFFFYFFFFSHFFFFFFFFFFSRNIFVSKFQSHFGPLLFHFRFHFVLDFGFPWLSLTLRMCVDPPCRRLGCWKVVPLASICGTFRHL